MSCVSVPDDRTVQQDDVAKILQSSMQLVGKADKEGPEGERKTKQGLANDGINQAIELLQVLSHRANSYDPEDSSMDLQQSSGESATLIHGSSTQIDRLASTARTTTHSLHQLVHRLRSHDRKIGKKRTRAGSGGKEWKALQLVVGSVFNQSALPSPDPGSTCVLRRQSLAIAMLAVGITLSFQNSLDDSNNGSENPDDRDCSTQPITKMVSSALLSDLSAHVYESGLDDAPQTSEDLVVYEVSRSIVLELLRHFVQRYNNGETMRNSSIIDIQVINKLARAFCIGGRGGEAKEDSELHHAISNIVVTIFGRRMLDDYSESIDGGDEVISKDADAAVLSLVASTRPWKVVKADRLVSIAAEYDLWFAAENICDAAVTSVGELNSDQTQYSVAHSTARAIIDAALGYRQYRRADQFASKYYSFGGLERYAEARYLHACDTISKLVRKKVAPLIDKQIEGVDAAVARVRKDSVLPMFVSSQCNERRSNRTSIDTMSENVREFSLRRLRAANMNAEALRLARLWGMTYEHDPVQMMHEAKLRQQNYLQWNEKGCPGYTTNNAGGFYSSLDLISDPTDLICQFGVLQENNDERTIGFDAEWGDDDPGVSLLQLSSTSKTMLLDIPALTSTSQGCDALRITVGQLFSGALDVQFVVGFSCKEDFSRLRASPSLPGSKGSKHWFPSHNILKARDLRHFIAETSPKLGSRGSPIGLSAACEHFLGKALDKSEQCSDWSARPLTREQLEYAALDAWACAAIHVKIASSQKVLPAP